MTGAQPTHSLPFPDGWRLIPDPGLLRRDGGKVLLGGTPFRLLRLSKAGSEQINTWFAGAPIGSDTSATDVARRLINNGMAHPVPLAYIKLASKNPSSKKATDQNLIDIEQSWGDGVEDQEITIVIPVKDDLRGLIVTLDSLSRSSDLLLPIIIVDDGSRIPITRRLLDAPDNVQIIRNNVAGGPGPARNRGFEGVGTQLVAFVDAGVRLGCGDLLHLAQHLADPDVVAAAPRVRSCQTGDQATPNRSAPDRSVPDFAALDCAGLDCAGPDCAGPGATSQSVAIAQYERGHSPLDLGQQPALVKPGSRVSYVPSACLIVDAAALRTLGQASFVFDPGLRYGEDVDLEWRLNREGSIRYDPSVVVTHPPRPDIVAFARQRIGYGSAAAALAERHGRIVAPFRSSRWSMAFLVLLLTRHPALAGLVGVRSTILTSQKLRGRLPDHQIEAVRLSTVGHVTSGVALGQTAIRSWWPATLAGLAVPLLRPPVLRLVGWGLATKLWRHRQDENPIIQAAIGLLDDLSYGFGLWQGAWSERSLRALLPDLT